VRVAAKITHLQRCLETKVLAETAQTLPCTIVLVPDQAAVATGKWRQSVPLQKQHIFLDRHDVQQLPLNLDEYNHACLTGEAFCVAIFAAGLTCLCDLSRVVFQQSVDVTG
jgi:hypothetical protein